MSKALLASKVVVIEEEPSVRGIASASTSVAGAVGLTEKGPVGQAVLCTSFEEYKKTFGGFTTSADVALAAKGFFENGGGQLWVSRVASPFASYAGADLLVAGTQGIPTAASVLTTASLPFALETTHDAISVDVEASVSDGSRWSGSLYFSGASAILPSNATSPLNLSDGQTLIFRVDGGPPQIVTFRSSQFANIHAATDAEIAVAVNAQLSGAAMDSFGLAVRSATFGSASSLDCTGGTAAPLFAFIGPGGGNGTVANMGKVTLADVTAAIAQAGGASFIRAVAVGNVMRIETVAKGAETSLRVTGIAADDMGLTSIRQWGSDGGPTPANLIGLAPGPFDLAPGDTLTVSYREVEGGDLLDATLTFQATAGQVKSTNNQPFTLANNQTLSVSVNGGIAQTVTFHTAQFANIAAATAAEVRAAIQAGISGIETTPLLSGDSGKVVIRSTTKGTASSIQMWGGTAVTALGLAGQEGFGSGNVLDIDHVRASDVVAAAETGLAGAAVTVTTYGSRLRIVSNLTGTDAMLAVTGSAASTLGFDGSIVLGSVPVSAGAVVHVDAAGVGAYGNALSVEALAPTGGAAGRFDLVVYDGGVEAERFTDLTRDPEDERFLETIVNDPVFGSSLVSAYATFDLPAATPPDFGQTVALAGGADDLTNISDSDFVGDPTAGTGLYVFDNIADISLLLVPGRATPAVHNAMLAYCEGQRDGGTFAILDPPAGLSAAQMVSYVSTVASLENASEYGAIYWPRVMVQTPDRGVFGGASQIVVPPSGILAGLYARTDGARPGGVFDPPAGVENGIMFGVLGFETDEVLNERKRDLVYPHRINPLTTSRGLPKYVDGSRTLKGDGSFPFVAQRRGVIFIERSLKEGLQFARHKSNTAELRAQVRRTITAFLLAQTNNGAFQSRDPTKAFFVDVSDRINTPSVVASGRLIARVGVATSRPAEFIVLEISQDTRALDEELATAG